MIFVFRFYANLSDWLTGVTNQSESHAVKFLFFGYVGP